MKYLSPVSQKYLETTSRQNFTEAFSSDAVISEWFYDFEEKVNRWLNNASFNRKGIAFFYEGCPKDDVWADLLSKTSSTVRADENLMKILKQRFQFFYLKAEQKLSGCISDEVLTLQTQKENEQVLKNFQKQYRDFVKNSISKNGADKFEENLLMPLSMTNEPLYDEIVRKLEYYENVIGLPREDILNYIDLKKKYGESSVKDDLYYSTLESKFENLSKFSEDYTTLLNYLEKGVKSENVEILLYKEIDMSTKIQESPDYFKDLIQKRRAAPGEDFLSVLLQYQTHYGLTDDELISQAIMMLVAGEVTTTDQMCNNLYTLMTTENKAALLSNAADGLSSILEECARLDPAVTFIFRVCQEDTVLADQTIKKGDVIFISCHAVNRDPNIFEHPNKLDPVSHNAKHLSFGYGGHFCLGAKLGRLEMSMVFESLFKHFPNLKLDLSQCARKHHSLAFSGFEKMLIAC